MNDKELQELYLQRTQLNNRISELEREQLIIRRKENESLVGKCFKKFDGASEYYLKITSTKTTYPSANYVKTLKFCTHPSIFDINDLFFFEDELIDTIHTRYQEIDKMEFRTKASEVFERMLNYEA